MISLNLLSTANLRLLILVDIAPIAGLDVYLFQVEGALRLAIAW
jgi:hypothetical protein